MKKEIPKRKKQNKNPKKRNHPKDNPAQQAKELQKLLGVNVPVPRLPQRPRKKQKRTGPLPPVMPPEITDWGEVLLAPTNLPPPPDLEDFLKKHVGCRK